MSERHPLKIGKTTNAMMLGGAKYLDVYIKQTAIQNAMATTNIPIGKHSEGHFINQYFFNNLHDELLIPTLVIIVPKNNSLVFISDKRDMYNRPILISIALEREQRNISINRITRIYGRKDFNDYVKRQLNNIIGYNIEKADNLLLASQVQFLRQCQ